MVSQHLHTLPCSTCAIRSPSSPADPCADLVAGCLRPSPPFLAHVSIRIKVLTIYVCSAKHLLSQERLPFTATYFGSIGLTLWFAVGVRMPIFLFSLICRFILLPAHFRTCIWLAYCSTDQSWSRRQAAGFLPAPSPARQSSTFPAFPCSRLCDDLTSAHQLRTLATSGRDSTPHRHC